MKNIKMSAPWYIYFEQLKALFEQDDEVDLDIIEENEGYKIEIFVADDIKADAIAKLLPEKKIFGNVEVPIYVYPSTNERDGWIETFADAFEGNPIIEDILPYGRETIVFAVRKGAHFMEHAAGHEKAHKRALSRAGGPAAVLGGVGLGR